MNHDLKIYGMHCKACELLLRHSITDLGDCKVNTISHKTGKIQVVCETSKLSEIEEAVIKAGYSLTPLITPEEVKADAIVGKAAWLVIAGVIIWLVMKSDVSSLLPRYDDLTFSIALIVGLVASVSTCLAVTGGIVIGYAESVETKRNRLTQLKFHAGRFVAFIIGGAILGMIGGQFSGSVRFNALFSILVGIVLFYLGLQLLGLLPNITKRGFHLPSGLSSFVFKLKNPSYAPAVGMLTFFLPCGFTQSMQLFALQSGSPLQGAMIMGAFAIGTLPVLYGLGIGVKYIKDKISLLNPLIAALLVAFGITTIFNGYTLINALNSSSTPPVLVENLDTETIQVGHDGIQFIPETIQLTAGKNYKLVVTPTSDGLGCFTQVVIPGGGTQAIIKGQPFEIFVDGSSPGRVPLVCASMGMSMGQIVVK